MAYELGEQLDWRFPTGSIHRRRPAGSAVEAFEEMEEDGWKTPGTRREGRAG